MTIINISSRSGLVRIPGAAAYAASKAAMRNHIKTVLLYCCEKRLQDPLQLHPSRSHPHAALYLASEESKYATGIELTIDGGLLAGVGASPHKRRCEGS